MYYTKTISIAFEGWADDMLTVNGCEYGAFVPLADWPKGGAGRLDATEAMMIVLWKVQQFYVPGR